jgi:hypothetical protein
MFAFSDIREGATICLLANLMEELNIDNTVDIYHQARKIAYACPGFRTEVRIFLMNDLLIIIFQG